jgi:hypothetical protein
LNNYWDETDMRIYHGSDIAVPEPEILGSNRLLDFGEGFYTTSSFEQACRSN